jgi:hypothetical protein
MAKLLSGTFARSEHAVHDVRSTSILIVLLERELLEPELLLKLSRKLLRCRELLEPELLLELLEPELLLELLGPELLLLLESLLKMRQQLPHLVSSVEKSTRLLNTLPADLRALPT